MQETFHDVFETALGWVGIVTAGGKVLRTTLPEGSRLAGLEAIEPHTQSSTYDPEASDRQRELIRRYCAGESVDLTSLPVALGGSPVFFRNAWLACRNIPAGETRSYAWLASQAGNARAARAAGQAMARNRLPLLVPCHRVVGSDGGLHGFGGGGLSMKARLLELESRVEPAS